MNDEDIIGSLPTPQFNKGKSLFLNLYEPYGALIIRKNP